MSRTIGKIIGIGWNYVKHANELQATLPTEPLFFLKPSSSIIRQGAIEIPPGCIVHHEIELGLVIGKDGRDIAEADAMDHISHYAAALTVQVDAKLHGNPWTRSKAYDTFCPLGELIPKTDVRDPHDLQLDLLVDGVLRQSGSTRDLIFKIPRLIEYLSAVMTLKQGDIILTGTPEGVGPVRHNQTIVGHLYDGSSRGRLLSQIEFSVVDRL
ncbi:hypothetical protein HDU91_001149 [Kappamyces sp. JEL0680]|nr:hypothetical protein HDU91_001149 [Kappamyces sp. JEL0680]